MWSDQEPEDPPGGGAQRALQQNERPERCSWPGPLLAYDLKPNKTKKKNLPASFVKAWTRYANKVGTDDLPSSGRSVI